MLATLRRLIDDGIVSRVGVVFRPGSVGCSTLAAMAVPPARLANVARSVSAHPGVNHNYEREHRLNLWFVVTAASRWRVDQVLREIEYRTSIPVIDLPLEEAFRLDLGFRLS